MKEDSSFDKSLTPDTLEVFEDISSMASLKNFYLCGGTAIALQLRHRLSEDLDFEIFNSKQPLNISSVEADLNSLFNNVRKEILGDDHIQFYVNNTVKLSFFNPKLNIIGLKPGLQHNQMSVIGLQDMLGMKLFTIMIRTVYRDYYDIYSLLANGYSLKDGISFACKISGHKIHTQNILKNLRWVINVDEDPSFSQMTPKYNVSKEDMLVLFNNTIQQNL